MKRNFLIPATLFVTFIAGMATPSNAEILTYTKGHGDIGVAYEDGKLELHYHFTEQTTLDGTTLGPGNHEFSPSKIAVRVTDQFGIRSSITDPLPANFAFIGANVPGNLWVLPPTLNANAPFLGLATEELVPADWTTPITWSMTSWVAPSGGNFALWNVDGLGNPSAFLSTFDPGATLSNNSFDLPIETHNHFNFGFTERGLYLIDFEVSGVHATDGLVSDSGTFRFLVGDATAVPEPGSIALLCAGTVGVIGGIRSRRRKQSEAEPQLS